MDNNRKDMKSKFYEPELTEFRIGFRFECLVHQHLGELGWKEFTVPDGKYLDFILKELNTGRIKVAYLCEEDILSLGFDKKEKTYYKPTIHRVWYEKQVEEDTACLSIYDNKLRIMISSKTLFEGQVKNINELEVILKQVGV